MLSQSTVPVVVVVVTVVHVVSWTAGFESVSGSNAESN